MNQLQLEAIKALSQQESLAAVALSNISVSIQKTAVWAVYKDLVHEGLYIAHTLAPDLELSEEGLYAVAKLARVLWQLDQPREHSSTCFLCDEKLPEYPEDLCKCLGSTWEFDLCPNGWTHDRLDFFINKYGAQHTARAYYCRAPNCTYNQLCNWSLRTIENFMRSISRNAVWHPPKNKLCHMCYKAGSTRPPQRTKRPAVPSKMSINDIVRGMNLGPNAES